MCINTDEFPNLLGDGYVPGSPSESPTDPSYNCAAFAAGVVNAIWCAGGVWPDDLPLDDCAETLIKVYEREGFELCANGSLEGGYQKIALYGWNGIWEHVAVQQQTDRWKSKMGIDHEDIEHPRPESVADGSFGPVLCFMKRVIEGKGHEKKEITESAN